MIIFDLFEDQNQLSEFAPPEDHNWDDGELDDPVGRAAYRAAMTIKAWRMDRTTAINTLASYPQLTQQLRVLEPDILTNRTELKELLDWAVTQARISDESMMDIGNDPMMNPPGGFDEGVAEGSTSHAELAKMAHDAYVAASRKGNGTMATHYLKQYQKHKADAAKEKQGVAEGRENFNGIDISMEIQKDDEYVDDEDYDNQVLYVTASSKGKELGHVLFAFDGEYLMPQDLEVEERYRGQGIAQTMYDYVKSKGYKIRRSGQQTDAGAGFWDKHKGLGQNVWEQGVAEGSEHEGLVLQFLKSITPKELRYYSIRDNCGPAALHMMDWAKEKGIELHRVNGYFVADNVIYDKADFTKEMKHEFLQQGLDFNDPKSRQEFIASNPKYSKEWKKVPHYWLQDDRGTVYDPTGYIQFIKTGLAKDLDKSRYETVQGVAEGSQSFRNGMQVKLTPEYADRPDEVFTVSRCDQERGRCWIGDEQGRGWSATFDQLIPVEDDEDDMFENTPKMSAREKLQRAVDREKKQAQQDRTGLAGMDYDQVQRQLRGIQDRTKPKKVDEDSDNPAVEQAIARRIMVGHTDLLLKYGPRRVMRAVEQVADHVGPTDEIGTSDVSGWVHQVKQILGAVAEAKAVKTRLDPHCWTGKKIGTPKTKVKNGVRVNNCVPK